MHVARGRVGCGAGECRECSTVAAPKARSHLRCPRSSQAAAPCIGTAPNMPWPGASCSTARIDLEINTARRSWCDKKVRGLAGIKFQVLDS